MPIFSYSTKASKPDDTQMVKDIKAYCEANNLNLSGIIVNLLREWWKKQNG